MKKFLSVTALLLVAIMLLSVVPASAETVNPWTAPEGVGVWYANDISENEDPVLDGTISDGEYGRRTAKFEPGDDYHETFAAPSTGNHDNKIDDARANQPAPNELSFWFAYDADYIYFAMEDAGGSWDESSETYAFLQSVLGDDAATAGTSASRSNYHLYLGWDVNNVGTNLSLQASSRGFDETKWFSSGSAMGGLDAKYTGVGTITAGCYIKKTDVATGATVAEAPTGFKNDNGGADRGNPSYNGGQNKTVIEMKLSKETLLEYYNELFNDTMIELPNAMWIRFTARTYVTNAAGSADLGGDTLGYNNYFITDVRADTDDAEFGNEYTADDFIDWGCSATRDWMPGLLVFGDEDTELSEGRFEGDPEYPEEGESVEPTTEPATTEPATTEPATTEPATTEEADDETTKAPTTKAPETKAPETDAPEETGGCGGSVSVAGLALVAALGTCTVFVAKKKED